MDLPNDRQRGKGKVGPSDRDALTALREQFLRDPLHTDLSALRPVIARSWRRSALCNVSTAKKVMDTTADPQIDEQFLRAANPVMAELERLCIDTHGCVSLADPMGTMAVFRGEPSMVRWADKTFPTLGGCMSEDLVGTNSDGTAIEEGEAVQVWGGEHFNDALQDTYCTSVPIRDPLRRSIRGVLSLSLPERLASGLDPRSILMVVRGAAAQITSALAERLAAREQALLSEYLREVRKRGADAVVALDDHMTIMNRGAMQLLEQPDYAVLAAYARDSATQRSTEHEVRCSSERILHLHMRPVSDDDASAGTIMRLKPLEQKEARLIAVSAAPRQDPFKGLVGESLAIRKAIDAAMTAVDLRRSAYILGETGCGKRHLAAMIGSQLAPHPSDVREITLGGDDAASVADTCSQALTAGEVLIVHKADRLDPDLALHLTNLVKTRPDALLVLTAKTVSEPLLPVITALNGLEIQLPALRTRREDIPALIRHFLQNATPLRQPTGRLVEQLAAAEWPGNVAQLKEVVEAAALQSSNHEVRPEDVTEVHRRLLARNRLSRLQMAEMEQIREALVEARGNRVRAASILRIGRSTLYRRIDFYASRGYDVELH